MEPSVESLAKVKNDLICEVKLTENQAIFIDYTGGKNGS
jgi:hypothetical protein